MSTCHLLEPVAQSRVPPASAGLAERPSPALNQRLAELERLFRLTQEHDGSWRLWALLRRYREECNP